MKKNLSRLLVSLFSIFLFVLSCQREDLGNKESKKTRTAEDFFKRSSQTNTFAKSGADYVTILEAYNQETNFISEIEDQEGLPIWEKMQTTEETETITLFIPLSVDDGALSSLLLVRLDENNTVLSFRNFTNEYLKNYVYNENYLKENRQFLMDTFLRMDY